MAEVCGDDVEGALLLPGGHGADAELTDNEFADMDYSVWDVGTEWTPLTDEDIIAAWTRPRVEPDQEHCRMMAVLDRTLPKRSYEAMLRENRVPVTQ